jgi:divalent metal cation (Fe/Co/Zn/Cd) transporter
VTPDSDGPLRRAIRLVALLNLAYFGVEFAVALAIGSVSLFADSVDFLEDASLNLLVLLALGWSAPRRAKLGMALAGLLLVPGIATLWTAWAQFASPVAAGPGAAHAGWGGGAGGERGVRAAAGAVQAARREPDAGGVPVGAE